MSAQQRQAAWARFQQARPRRGQYRHKVLGRKIIRQQLRSAKAIIDRAIQTGNKKTIRTAVNVTIGRTGNVANLSFAKRGASARAAKSVDYLRSAFASGGGGGRISNGGGGKSSNGGKRVPSQAQLDALARGRAKRKANIQNNKPARQKQTLGMLSAPSKRIEIVERMDDERDRQGISGSNFGKRTRYDDDEVKDQIEKVQRLRKELDRRMKNP